MQKSTRNIPSILLLILLGTMCLLPGLMLLQFDGETLSAAENRSLAALPDIPTDAESLVAWPTRFESFVADHFGFRAKLVRMYNLIHMKAGVSPISRVRVGKDGWLFLEETWLGETNRGAHPFSDRQLENLVESFELRHRYLDSRQKLLVVFPVPDKNSLYPEFLPDSVKIVGPSRFRQFRKAARNAGFHAVDSLLALETAKQNGEAVYYKTDSHWNCRGAWFGYLALMAKIREVGYQGGRILDESEINFNRLEKPHNTDIVHNLLNLSGEFQEPYSFTCNPNMSADIKATRPSDGQSFDYIYSAPPPKEHRSYRRSEPRDRSRVLLYRDSYANAMVPYLIHSFDEVIYAAPTDVMGFDPADVERYDPDLVIYQFVERILIYPPVDDLLRAQPANINPLASSQRAVSNPVQIRNQAGIYQWGEKITFGNQGNSRPYQNGGWTTPATPLVTWTQGANASLAVDFSEINGPVTMRVKIKPLVSPGKLDHQQVRVFVGPENVGEWLVSFNNFHTIELVIPGGLFNPSGKTDIKFALPDAKTPQSLGIGTDLRVVSLAFMSIEFERTGDNDES